MYTTKSTKIDKTTLKIGQVVWSEYFKAYVSYEGKDFDEDLLFKFLHKERYCVIMDSEVYEPASLIKELL